MTSSLAGIAVDDHVVRRSEVISAVLTAISFAIGALVVVQASLNINLGDTLGQPIRASCVSFWVGTVVLVVVVLRKHTGKKDWWRISDNEELPISTEYVTERISKARLHYVLECLPAWYYYGGQYGAVYITTTVLVVPHIGFSIFFVCHVSGQLIWALIIDKWGLFSAEKRRISTGRIMGCALTVAGSLMILFSDKGETQLSAGTTFALVLVSVWSGSLVPSQAATNNKLKQVKGWDTALTSCFSFFTAAVVLSVVYALTFLFVSPSYFDHSNNSPFHWFGGVLGTLYVAAGVAIPSRIGYAAFFVAVVSGQLTMSLLSDSFGWLGPKVSSARSPLSICGVLGAVLGAVVVAKCKAVVLQDVESIGNVTSVAFGLDSGVDDKCVVEVKALPIDVCP